MADGEAAKGGGKGLKRRLGPLSMGGWLLSLGGAGALFILFKRYEAGRNAAAAGGGTGAGVLTGGGTIPAGGVGGSAGNPPFSDYGAWLTAAVAQIASGGGVDSGQALDGIQTWLGGGCVSQRVYNAITQSVISNTSIGLPPGWGTSIPPLTVCAAAAPPPPPPPPPAPAPSAPAAAAPAPPPVFGGLSGALSSQLTNNGESVASVQWDRVLNEFIVLTNKGGIYNVNAQGQPSGGTFYGSYLGLPAQDRQGTRTFNQLRINADGTYTAIATTGESYTFDPGIARLEGLPG